MKKKKKKGAFPCDFIPNNKFESSHSCIYNLTLRQQVDNARQENKN